MGRELRYEKTEGKEDRRPSPDDLPEMRLGRRPRDRPRLAGGASAWRSVSLCRLRCRDRRRLEMALRDLRPRMVEQGIRVAGAVCVEAFGEPGQRTLVLFFTSEDSYQCAEAFGEPCRRTN